MKILITGSAGFIGYHLSKSLLEDQYEVHGIDISEGFIEQCNLLKKELSISNFYPHHTKNQNLPYDNNTFDIILLFDVIHHLENIDQNFSEIKRNLLDI